MGWNGMGWVGVVRFPEKLRTSPPGGASCNFPANDWPSQAESTKKAKRILEESGEKYKIWPKKVSACRVIHVFINCSLLGIRGPQKTNS